MDNDGMWFAPKAFGYGTGRPIAWQGWAITIVYAGVVAGAAPLLAERSMPAFLAVMFGTTVPFVLVASRKTRGGLRWRWGIED